MYILSIITLFGIANAFGSKTLEFQLPNSIVQPSISMNQPVENNQPLQLSCSYTQQTNSELILNYQIKNVSNKAMHIFDNQNMPYLILQEDGSLLVLHGVNPPEPNTEYPFIEIPITRSIEPGEIVSHQVKLKPLYLADHYKMDRTPTDLHRSVTVYCQVAWSETPILASQRHKTSINSLLKWQKFISSQPIHINFP